MEKELLLTIAKLCLRMVEQIESIEKLEEDVADWKKAYVNAALEAKAIKERVVDDGE